MARIFIDGFEGENFDCWTNADTGIHIGVSTITGNASVEFDETQALSKTLANGVTTLGVGMNIRLISGGPVIRMYSNIGMVLAVKIIFAAGTYRGYWIQDGIEGLMDSFTYYTGAPEDVFNLQIKVTNLSAGIYTYEVLQDGVEMLSGGFAYESGEILNSLQIYCPFGAGNPGFFIDDVVLDDAELPGSSEIYGLIPYANGTTSEWSSTDSTNFQSVDDIPINEANYIYTDVFDAIDLFSLTDLPVSGRTVKAFSMYAYSKQMAGPPPTEHIRFVLRTDSTNFLGAIEDIHNVTDFGRMEQLFVVSPSSREAWEEAKINDLEIGVKLVV